MHFRAIFQTEVSNYYLDILRKAGGTPPHTAEIKATCWALVTKLLRVCSKRFTVWGCTQQALNTWREIRHMQEPQGWSFAGI